MIRTLFVLIIGILSLFAPAAAAQAQSLSCAGGIEMAEGVFFLDVIPEGCSQLGNFVKFENATKYCLAPLINGLPETSISVTSASSPIVGYGVERSLDPLNASDIVDCVPGGHSGYGFVGHAERVSIGAVGYEMTTGAYGRAPIVGVKMSGMPVIIMNAVSLQTGLPVPSAQKVAGTWNPVSYNLESGGSVRYDTTTGLPVFRFDGTTPHL